jgi:protein-L-isoaspartate(D-aspartate) O-methyltransferase
VGVDQLRHARLSFAKEIQRLGNIKSGGLIEALASVPRESFMGPGPWKIMSASEIAQGYRLTPDNDPRHLYQNVLVALDEERRLNNGEPLGLLLFLDSLSLSAGERFLHIGCGVGYYTALTANALGPQGTVMAVELDPALAARAELNLRAYPTVKFVAGDGTRRQFGTFDAIFINAGCTQVEPIWLDQLAVGGRLLLPLTVGLPGMSALGAGNMLLVTRLGAEYAARFTSPVGIFHCEGARSIDGEASLSRALASGNTASVARLRRDVHAPGPNCWLHMAGACLESDPRLRRQTPKAIQLAPQILTRYVGHYELAPNLLLSIAERGGELLAQVAGSAAVPIYPESQTRFFYTVIEAQITFVTDASGSVTGLVFSQYGRDISARRVGSGDRQS